MLLAEAVPETVLQIGLPAAGSIGLSIGGALIGAVKLMLNYLERRDVRTEAQAENLVIRMEALMTRTETQNATSRSDYKETMGALLKIQEKSVETTQTAAAKLDTLSERLRAIDGLPVPRTANARG